MKIPFLHLIPVDTRIGNRRGLIIERETFNKRISAVSILFSINFIAHEYWARFVIDIDETRVSCKSGRFSCTFLSGKYKKEVTL